MTRYSKKGSTILNKESPAPLEFQTNLAYYLMLILLMIPMTINNLSHFYMLHILFIRYSQYDIEKRKSMPYR